MRLGPKIELSIFLLLCQYSIVTNKMASFTTIYHVIERTLLHTTRCISLSPINYDGHDLTNLENLKTITVPHEIKDNDIVLVVAKKNAGPICSIAPYLFDKDETVVNSDEESYTTTITIESWYGTR